MRMTRTNEKKNNLESNKHGMMGRLFRYGSFVLYPMVVLDCDYQRKRDILHPNGSRLNHYITELTAQDHCPPNFQFIHHSICDC